MAEQQNIPTSQVETVQPVEVRIAWDEARGHTQTLHLPDGTSIVLNDEQFEHLQENIEGITSEARDEVCSDVRRTANNPEQFGLVKGTCDYEPGTQHEAWRSPEHPDGPAITFRPYGAWWYLTIPELGPHNVQQPLEIVAWNDTEGMRHLCELVGDPYAVQMLASLQHPERLADTAIIRAHQAEWEALTDSSKLLKRTVRHNATRYALEGNTPPDELWFASVTVRRDHLRLTGWTGSYDEHATCELGVQVWNTNGQPLTDLTRLWVEALTRSGKWKATAVTTGDRLFIVRNEATFRRIEAAGLIQVED